MGLANALIVALIAPTAAELVAYYSWNWGSGSTGPRDATAGVAFTGLVDVDDALTGYQQNASWCCPPLPATAWLSLGGGNAAGEFDVPTLSKIDDAACARVAAAGYAGVVFDVEIVTGAAADVVPAFSRAFERVKAAGLTVVITTSHSAPYQTDSPSDAVALVRSWAADENVDVLSPQLYSSGDEKAPEFDETASCVDAGCTWDLYAGARADIMPSIVDDSQYAAVASWFAGRSLTTTGFVQWKQVAS